jgi:FixJ family two-component response regulator
MTPEPTVFVVDACESSCDAVSSLIRTMNVPCEAFASGEAFLKAGVLDRPGCVVLDVRLPDINGLQVQEHIAQLQSALPVVFLTGDASVSIAVHAMRCGAIHFLEKPVREHDVWEAIQEGLRVNAQRRAAQIRRRQYEQRLELLSSKEREILQMIARGHNKRDIALELDVSTRTVESRRKQLMEKLDIDCTASLIRFAVLAGNGHASAADTWVTERFEAVAANGHEDEPAMLKPR